MESDLFQSVNMQTDLVESLQLQSQVQAFLWAQVFSKEEAIKNGIGIMHQKWDTGCLLALFAGI